MRDFRFSFNVFSAGGESPAAFAHRCRQAEDYGYDTVFERLPDGMRTPQPVQRHGFGGSGPPLIVGGTGDRTLRIAAEHADIVSIAGLYQVAGEPPGRFRLGTAAETAERVRFVRDTRESVRTRSSGTS
ncbi:MAG: hypothetical protein ACRDPK_11860 [Carbonactinosporaceae bacterium]